MGFFDPIDFSGIVGYPHDISEDAIDNVPEWHHGHASYHIVIFTEFIKKWCDPPVYEDVLMQILVFTLVRDPEMFWFKESLDKSIKYTARSNPCWLLEILGREALTDIQSLFPNLIFSLCFLSCFCFV
jgi:hypothetical protein